MRTEVEPLFYRQENNGSYMTKPKIIHNAAKVHLNIHGNKTCFIIGKKIASGSFGVVYHATLNINKTHPEYYQLIKKQWVIKEVHSYFNPSEIEINANYSYVSEVQHLSSKRCRWALEYVPGNHFFPHEFKQKTVIFLQTIRKNKKHMSSDNTTLILYKEDNNFVYFMRDEDGNLIKHDLIDKEEQLTIQQAQQLSNDFTTIESNYTPYESKQSVDIRASILQITANRGHTLRTLDFMEIMQLIFELTVRVNLFHHHTPSSGPAIIHGDISCNNIKFQINTKPINNEINLYDYGLSIKLDHDNPDILQYNMNAPINPNSYFPIEVTYGKNFGIKTDIYMLAKCIKHTLNSLKWPETTPDISKLTQIFLNRSLSNQYDDRPDSDEFMKFFTVLNNFYKLNQLDNENIAQQFLYSAQLAILCMNKNYQYVNEATDSFKWESKWERCNSQLFAALEVDNINLNALIYSIGLYECDVDYSLLFKQANLTRSLSTLHQCGHLNKDVIEIICNDHTLWDFFAEFDFKNTPLLSILPELPGTLENKRKIAIALISQQLTLLKTDTEVDELITSLVTMAEKQQINYLYARQGYFTFSFHRHQFNNNDVSGTWVHLMKMGLDKKNALAYKLIALDDFKEAYITEYNNAFFKNPYSTMKAKIEESELMNMDLVLEYAQNNPDSRTTNVMNSLIKLSNI